MKHLLLWGIAGVVLGYLFSSTLQSLPLLGTIYTSADSAGQP